jgi:hypothetical protein
VEERDHTCIGDQQFRILGDEKIRTGEVVKSQNATVPQSKQLSEDRCHRISEFGTWKGPWTSGFEIVKF